MSINFNSASLNSTFLKPSSSFSLEELRKKVPNPESSSLVDQYFEVLMSKNVADEMDGIDTYVYNLLKASETELDVSFPEPDLNALVEAFGLVNAFILFGCCFKLASCAEKQQGEKLAKRVQKLGDILMRLASNRNNPDYLKLEHAKFDLEKLKFVKEKVSLSAVTELSKCFKAEEKLQQPLVQSSRQRIIALIGAIGGIILLGLLQKAPTKIYDYDPDKTLSLTRGCLGSKDVSCKGIVSTAFNELLVHGYEYRAFSLAQECLENSECDLTKDVYLKSLEMRFPSVSDLEKPKWNAIHTRGLATACAGNYNLVCDFIVNRAFFDLQEEAPELAVTVVTNGILNNDKRITHRIEKIYSKLSEKNKEWVRGHAVMMCLGLGMKEEKTHPICNFFPPRSLED